MSVNNVLRRNATPITLIRTGKFDTAKGKPESQEVEIVAVVEEKFNSFTEKDTLTLTVPDQGLEIKKTYKLMLRDEVYQINSVKPMLFPAETVYKVEASK